MARPKKKGLHYFSFDVDILDDEKIQFLLAEHGNNGLAAYVILLTIIYRDHGYFMLFNERRCKLLAPPCRVDALTLSQIVDCCLSENLFNKYLFEKYSILTSARIQKNFIAGCLNRLEINLIKEFLLINPETYKHEKNKIVLSSYTLDFLVLSGETTVLPSLNQVTPLIDQAKQGFPPHPGTQIEIEKESKKRESAINGSSTKSEKGNLNGHKKSPLAPFDFNIFLKEIYKDRVLYEKYRKMLNPSTPFSEFQKDIRRLRQEILKGKAEEYPQNEIQCLARVEKWLESDFSVFAKKV